MATVLGTPRPSGDGCILSAVIAATVSLAVLGIGLAAMPPARAHAVL